CKILLKGDSYFKGKDVDTTKINKEIPIKSYCYNDDCKTNGERINALTVYIYMEFKKSIRQTDYNTYDECLLMWISNILFRIHDKSNPKKVKTRYIDTITLNSAYEKYLKDHKVKLKYWEFFDSIKDLKEANLRYMAEFYKLLNRICKTIGDYKNNGAGSNNLSKYSKNCLTQYRSLYLSISECDSYLRLLNKLKGIYDDFRVSAIKENSSNNNLETNLKKLTKPNEEEMNAVRSFKQYKIPKKKCYSQKKKTDPPRPQASSQAAGSENKGNVEGTTQSVQKNGPNTSKGIDSGTGNTKDNANIEESGKKGSNSVTTKQIADSKSGIPSDGTGNENSNKGGAALGTGGPGNETDGGQSSVQNGQESSGGGTKDTKSVQGDVPDGQISNGTQGGENTSQEGTSDGSGSDTGNQGGDTGDDKGSTDNNPLNGGGEQGGQDDQKSQDGSRDSESGPGSEQNPTPNGSPTPQKHTSQTPSGTPHISSPSPDPKEQTTPFQSSQGTSGNQNSDRTNQEGPKKPVTSPVVKKENIGTELKGNVITEIGGEY
ncbi:hypothetical protein YYE_05004, partial [Plasmodium vinckei vinckei]